ncbi:replicative DNA helicase domain protein [Mycobacterium xenopi 4042]|uniref:Replicative DNA helicase domain protein n=1 Tax=Mycobacterium xenopi 4042 TaxID=1299334 RepID=X8DBG3_MYCXE|nr:replicative DNA helicase domain protein [Mycobacterium xenopi 4042]
MVAATGVMLGGPALTSPSVTARSLPPTLNISGPRPPGYAPAVSCGLAIVCGRPRPWNCRRPRPWRYRHMRWALAGRRNHSLGRGQQLHGVALPARLTGSAS